MYHFLESILNFIPAVTTNYKFYENDHIRTRKIKLYKYVLQIVRNDYDSYSVKIYSQYIIYASNTKDVGKYIKNDNNIMIDIWKTYKSYKLDDIVSKINCELCELCDISCLLDNCEFICKNNDKIIKNIDLMNHLKSIYSNIPDDEIIYEVCGGMHEDFPFDGNWFIIRIKKFNLNDVTEWIPTYASCEVDRFYKIWERNMEIIRMNIIDLL